MSTHEPLSNINPYSDDDRPLYVTNGRDLLQIESTTNNYGLGGGRYTTLVDCLTGAVHVADELDMLALTEVTPRAPES